MCFMYSNCNLLYPSNPMQFLTGWLNEQSYLHPIIILAYLNVFNERAYHHYATALCLFLIKEKEHFLLVLLGPNKVET